MASPKVKLNDGEEIPIFGLGTWKSEQNVVKKAVIEAVKIGYRHIDCAYDYGNEGEIGDALSELFAEGVVTRQEMFITSKLWNTFHSKGAVKSAFLDSLQSLKLEYLDLFLMHWPFGYVEGRGHIPLDNNNKTMMSDVDYLETWNAMEELKNDGLTKSIGVSNFNHLQIERLLANCQIPPAMVQIESHPYLTNKKLVNFCISKNITVTAYSPLGSPDRSNIKKDDPTLFTDPVVKSIADKYHKHPAQILIRWHIDRNMVVISKSTIKQELVDNLKVFEFRLTKDEVEQLEALDKPHRFNHLDWIRPHQYYPFDEEY